MTLRERLASVRSARWLRACERVGEGARLSGRPWIEPYGGTIRIGARFSLASRPVVSHFASGPGALLDIGADVTIGHGAAIAAFERITIGDGTRIAPFAIIMDTNFHGGSGDQSVQHDCRPVIIGRNCRIGARVTITRGVVIGDGAEILAGSVVSSGIPAGACAAGARARVLGPAGQLSTRWDSVSAILPLLVMEALDLTFLPELDTPLSELCADDRTALQRIIAGIRSHFGVEIDAAAGPPRLADVVALVEDARRGREGHAHAR